MTNYVFTGACVYYKDCNVWRQLLHVGQECIHWMEKRPVSCHKERRHCVPNQSLNSFLTNAFHVFGLLIDRVLVVDPVTVWLLFFGRLLVAGAMGMKHNVALQQNHIYYTI